MRLQLTYRADAVVSRLAKHQVKSFSTFPRAMASGLTINSRIRMNSGYEIPHLGFGVGGPMGWQGPDGADHDPADVCEAVCTKAFAEGFRHIDSAAAYRNEAPCGRAIANCDLPRSEIFFTSKVPPKALGYEKTKSVVDNTLKETGLEYIDLMLIHAPYGGRIGRKGAWKALLEAQDAGKVRSLGISNYGVQHLSEMEEYMKELEEERGPGKGGVIDVGQWELHPWCTRSDIVEWCQRRNIVLEAYSPLVRGQRMEEKSLQPLMRKYGKTAAQVLLRWSLQRGFVPLPKSVTPTRIEENIDIFDFKLTELELDSLETGEYTPCTWDPTTSGLED